MTAAELQNKAMMERLRLLGGRNRDPWFAARNKKRWGGGTVWPSEDWVFFFLEWRGKEWQLYLENQQTEKMVDKYPKEPSCPGLNANFLYKTKRGRWGGKVKKVVKVKVKSLSHVRLLMTPWTRVHQVPPSMGFSRQEYWSGLPCPPPGDLLHLLHCRRILHLLSHQKVNYPSKRSASSKSSRAWTLPVVSTTSFYDPRESHSPHPCSPQQVINSCKYFQALASL